MEILSGGGGQRGYTLRRSTPKGAITLFWKFQFLLLLLLPNSFPCLFYLFINFFVCTSIHIILFSRILLNVLHLSNLPFADWTPLHRMLYRSASLLRVNNYLFLYAITTLLHYQKRWVHSHLLQNYTNRTCLLKCLIVFIIWAVFSHFI